MSHQNRLIFIMGFSLLTLSIINYLLVNEITPEFERAQVISSISAVLVMLVSFLSSKLNNIEQIQEECLTGDEEFYISTKTTDSLKKELAWGSLMLLKNTNACTIYIYWKEEVLLKRGIIGKGKFIPGEVAKRAIETKKLISLVNTKLYPGRYEFDLIVENLPSILIYALGESGWIIIGGKYKKSFNDKDESWIEGWSQKIKEILDSDNNK